MKVSFKEIEGQYAVGPCGIVDLDAYEELEEAVENKKYAHFEKKELFWTIYDQIVLPTREKMNVNPDHTLRMLYIEEDGDTFVFRFNIDDYDETYFEVKGAADMILEDVISAFFDDLCNLKKALPEYEPMKSAITWENDRPIYIPADDFMDRLTHDVCYSSWEIENNR